MARQLLLPFQKHYLQLCDQQRYVLCTKSRQIGISLTEALWSLRRRLRTKQDHMYVSSCERTALQFMRYVKLWAQVFNIALGEEVINLTRDVTTTKLVMPNGSTIMAFPSGIDVVRGMRGDVTLDEAAICANAQDFIEASMPATMWGGVFHVISTAGLPGSWFEEERSRIAGGTSRYHEIKITIHDAIADGLADLVPGDHQKLPKGPARNAAFLAYLKVGVTDEAFQQEYECIPRGLGSLINDQEYDAVAISQTVEDLYAYEKLRNTHKRPLGPLFVGIDLGRHKDQTVVTVLERAVDQEHAGTPLEDVYVTLVARYLKAMPYRAQVEVLKPYVGHPLVERVLIDAAGIGNQLSEELSDEYPLVEQFHTTNTLKGVMAERVKSFVQQDRLAVPKGDKQMRDDFLAVVRTVTRGGALTYGGATPTSHCDGFWSLAMALHGAEREKVQVRVVSRPEPSRGIAALQSK